MKLCLLVGIGLIPLVIGFKVNAPRQELETIEEEEENPSSQLILSRKPREVGFNAFGITDFSNIDFSKSKSGNRKGRKRRGKGKKRQKGKGKKKNRNKNRKNRKNRNQRRRSNTYEDSDIIRQPLFDFGLGGPVATLKGAALEDAIRKQRENRQTRALKSKSSTSQQPLDFGFGFDFEEKKRSGRNSVDAMECIYDPITGRCVNDAINLGCFGDDSEDGGLFGC